MQNRLWKKGLVLGIIVLFVGASGVSGFNKNSNVKSRLPSEELIQEPPINFGVGFYLHSLTNRIAGMDEVDGYHNILVVKDLDTGETLTEFSKTGAVSNWDKIVNISEGNIQYYPNSIDMYNLTGNPNLWGLWLGLGVIYSPVQLEYISINPITQNNFSVFIQPWTDYSMQSSQSIGMYFDYIDINRTYLVKVIGGSEYTLEDLSTQTIITSGTFGWDNNPNYWIRLEVTNITDTDMHIWIICHNNNPHILYDGMLLRQKPLNEPPVANFTYTIDNLSVTFNASSSYDPDGNITTWLWEFGDGLEGTGEKIIHDYTHSGTYNVKLTVIDNNGFENNITKGIIIVPNQPPDAPIINGPSSGKAGKTYPYTFVSKDTDGDDVYYEINWGDGIVEPWDGPHKSNIIAIINHSWSERGTFTIMARAKDVHGAVGNWSELEITMPKSYFFSSCWFTWFLDRFLFLNQLFDILGR